MFRDTTEESNHAVCYLHYDGFAPAGRAELIERPLAAMRAHAPAAWPRSTQELHIRCIELHTYQAGGGLFLRSHRDNDSVLTLSARVSEDGAFDGGRFVTYDRGAPGGAPPRPGVRRALPLRKMQHRTGEKRAARGLVIERGRAIRTACDRVSHGDGGASAFSATGAARLRGAVCAATRFEA